MKSYVETKFCKLRDKKVSAKIVMENNGETDYYACRQMTYGSLDTSLIYRLDKQKRVWKKEDNLDSETLKALEKTFAQFMNESMGLYKRKMTDKKGEYHIMYRVSFIDDLELNTWDSKWNVKSDDWVVRVECDDSDYKNPIFLFKRKRMGAYDANFESFKPDEDERGRILKAALAGKNIRKARQAETSRQFQAKVFGGGLGHLTMQQRAYVRNERRAKSF